ncbi:hypothetical protein NEFER03_1520 [Nematocida sp. LUAm3]|nr:hypothetical protein NEFER03_1520 [Nematocida sp. LUAm3]KAI5174553.1 hypothetical protein NEFER02_0674 [Nematocida sp. LUAm2]KAI5178041.1 hypothetical protein NEFER01_1223 [Nematocida sp. LUAm1]
MIARYIIALVVFFANGVICSHKRQLNEEEERGKNLRNRVLSPPAKVHRRSHKKQHKLKVDELRTPFEDNLNTKTENNISQKIYEEIKECIDLYSLYSMKDIEEKDIVYWDLCLGMGGMFFRSSSAVYEAPKKIDFLEMRKMVTKEIIQKNGKVLFWISLIQLEKIPKNPAPGTREHNIKLQIEQEMKKMWGTFSSDANVVVTYYEEQYIVYGDEYVEVQRNIMRDRLKSLKEHLNFCSHSSGFLIYYNVLFMNSSLNNPARPEEADARATCPVSLFQNLNEYKNIYVVYDGYASYNQNRTLNIDNSIYNLSNNMDIEDFSSVWHENTATAGVICVTHNIQLSIPFFLQKITSLKNLYNLSFVVPNEQSGYVSNTQFKFAMSFPAILTLNGSALLTLLKEKGKSCFENTKIITVPNMVDITWLQYIAFILELSLCETIDDIMKKTTLQKSINCNIVKNLFKGKNLIFNNLGEIVYLSRKLLIIENKQYPNCMSYTFIISLDKRLNFITEQPQ